MSMKINLLEIENTKRIKAVRIRPTESGLTVIGGKNGQGKTSVLDAIAWALGGEKRRPSMAEREGSTLPPSLRVIMNNGLVVERKGKNSALKVTDPSGNKAGQKLLDSFVSELALDLPKFLNATPKEKAQTLLHVIGVEDRLSALEMEEKSLYNERVVVGREADRKKKFAEEQPYYPDAPADLVSVSELIRQQQEILARNGENQRKRDKAAQLEERTRILTMERNTMAEALREKEKQLEEVMSDLATAKKDAAELADESTRELEESIRNAEIINAKVRANMDKEKAEEDAKDCEKKYVELTTRINMAREAKTDLLKSAGLPLPELSVADGEIIYKGQKWDCMSSSEQMKVGAAIVRKLNPECGFILLDKLEQMDPDTEAEFGDWLEAEGLQGIATRVSDGGDGSCTIIIEDGYIKGQEEQENQDAGKKTQPAKTWKAGEF